MNPGKNPLVTAFIILQLCLLIIAGIILKENKVADNSLSVTIFYLLIITITVGYSRVLSTEINKRKKNEKHIASLSEILNNSNDAIYTVDVNGCIQSWNKGAEKLYGFTAGEALGFYSDQLLHANTQAANVGEIKDQINGNDYWLGELARKTKTGKDVFVFVSARAIREKDGTVTGYISASHDITEKINLKEQLTYLANLVDHSADAIISVKMDGKIISWNKRAESMYGYKAGEAIGKNVFMIVPEEMMNEEKAIIEEIKKGTAVYDFETQRIKKDGSRIAVSLTISPVKNSDGELIAVSGITRDISARKKSERQIVESEENLKAIFDNTSEGFVLTDTNGIIKASNKRAQKSILSNTTKKITAGKSIFEFIEPSRTDFLKKTFSDILSGKTIQYDHSYTSNAGAITWLSFTYNPVKNDRDKIVGICIAGLDITEKKIAEQQREFERSNLYALINNTNDLMWSVSRDFKLITSNQAFDEMTKRMSGKAMTKGSDIFTGQFDVQMQQRYRQYYERAFAGEAFTETEYTFTSFEYWAENSFYPIYEGNKVVGTACFSRNISSQKKTAELLQRSFDEQHLLADRMYSIINTLPANIALLNDTGIIIDVNNTWKNFADGNCFQGTDYGVGQNYITVAESFGNEEHDGKKVAAGIRSIIENKEKEFVFEYPCNATTEKRWFRMVVTPFKNREYTGAVVMHIDISEIRRLYHENLKSKLSEQKRLNTLVIRAQEKERNQLGRDLHDNICQLLGALKMKLDYCVITKSVDLVHIEECVKFLEDAIVETRDISHRMVIPRFADKSFTDALKNLSNTYCHENRKVLLDYGQADENIIPVAVKEALYRIVQEKLNNIHKYAKASCVKVVLNAHANAVIMTIEDNGIGFDTDKKKTGVGLTNIINRAESFNGSAKIISSPGNGCQLTIQIPLCDKQA